MVRKLQEQQEKTNDLGELPPELQVNTDVQKATIQPNELNEKWLIDNEKNDDTHKEMDGIYVVIKGRSVQHNGALYIENQQIKLNKSDAERLVDLGVVMSLLSVREQLVQTHLSGKVTINGN